MIFGKRLIIPFSIILITLLASCRDTGSIDSSAPALGEGTVISEAVTFKVYINHSWWAHKDWGSDLISREITKITGVNLDIDVPVTPEDAQTRLNLMLSSNNFPDIIMMQNGEHFRKLINKGALLPLDKLINEYGHNIKENITYDYLEGYCTGDDGKIYGLPNGFSPEGNEFSIESSGMLVLEKIYNKMGSPEIETIDDLYNYLLAVRDSKILDKKGGQVIPAYFDRPAEILAGSYGVRYVNFFGGSYVYNEDGKLEHVLRNPQMENVFMFTNRIFRKKIIDQKWFMQSRSKIQEKLVNGKIAVYFAGNAYSWLEEYNDVLKKNTGDRFIMLKLPAAKGVEKTEANYRSNEPWNYMTFTKQCKDPSLALKFFDWQAGRTGQVVSRIGPKGVVWDEDENGALYVTDEYKMRLKDDKADVLRETGYLKWCWNQNYKYHLDAANLFMDAEQINEHERWLQIVSGSTWAAPELEGLYIEPSSIEGIANSMLNTYYQKISKHLFMAKTEGMFENIYKEALYEMGTMGLELVEEQLNQQIEQNLSTGTAN